MQKNQLVSVVIPVFNGESFIVDTINSILSQKYKDIEIIVVDDGSIDRTCNLVKQYGSLVKYYHQKNSGGCSLPRNTGILYSRGDFICFLDSDDLIVPDHIAMQVDFFKRHPCVGLVFSDYQNFQDKKFAVNSHFQTCPALRSRIQGLEEIVLTDATLLLAKENFGSACSFMMKRTLLPYVGGFEVSLRSCEDFHFYYRLARYTSVGIINKIGMFRRLHDHNMSKNLSKMFSERIRSRKLLLETEPNHINRRMLKDYIAICIADYARHSANEGNYLYSFCYNFVGLRYSHSVRQLKKFFRNILRTVVFAIGSKK